MKATEEGNEDAAKVVLSAEDIRIIQNEASGSDSEADRVKTLGEFDVQIYPKGASQIQRTIRVQAEEA